MKKKGMKFKHSGLKLRTPGIESQWIVFGLQICFGLLWGNW